MIEHIPLIVTVLPTVVAIIIFVVNHFREFDVGLVATIATSVSVLLLLLLIPSLYLVITTSMDPIYVTYLWAPQINLNFGFYITGVSLLLGIIIALVCATACMFSIQYMKHRPSQRGYYENLLVFTTGMLGVIFSGNLIQFYFFWELMLIPSYLLISIWGPSQDAPRIGLKYFIYTHVGAISILMGILLVGSNTGSYDYLTILSRISLIPIETQS